MFEVLAFITIMGLLWSFFCGLSIFFADLDDWDKDEK